VLTTQEMIDKSTREKIIVAKIMIFKVDNKKKRKNGANFLIIIKTSFVMSV